MSKNSLKAATLAAAKVNAMLYAKGKLKLPDTQKNHSGHGMSDRTLDSLITREYEINDVPAPARNLLTRGFVQDEICKYSGASISTRGRYLTYEEKLNATSKDRPLYLHIQGSSKEAVNLALARIQEMIGQFDKSVKPAVDFSESSFSSSRVNSFNGSGIGSTPAPTSSGGHYVQDKVFVGLESSSSAFSVRERIIGPGGSFLQHIKTESGATVTLRGRGSGYIEQTSGQEAFEPMYIHLTHPKPEGLQAAKILALNLIDTVHAEYSLFQQQSEQSLMPVGMGAPSHLPFQGHVAVVCSVPTILTQTMIPSVAPGTCLPVVPAVSSVQTVLGQPMTSPASQCVYTSNHGTNFGFHGTYVNTLPDVTNVAPLPTLNTVPLPSITPVNLTPGPPLTMTTLGSVPIDGSAAPPTAVPLNGVASGLVAHNPSMSLSSMTPISVNPVTSMSQTMAPIPVNSVTSLPLSTMATIPVNTVTSIHHMNPLPVNPVTSLPLSNVTQVPVNLVTTMPPGPVSSVPINLLLPPGTATGPLSLDGAVTMGPPQMPMMPMGPPPPPLSQSTPGYREMVGQHTIGMPPQPLPPTTYTHLYLKQKQQQQQMPMLGGPPPIQHGHKRKFTEEGPDIMHPPMPIMPHHPPYSLQAGASLAPCGPGTEQQPFLAPPPPPGMRLPQQHLLRLGPNVKRHMAPRGDVDRDLMPPPDRRLTSSPAQAGNVRSKQEGTQAGSRTRIMDSDGKRLEGALGGLAALYNSDDSDEDASSGSKSSPIYNHK